MCLFPKGKRLLTRSDFDRVFKRSKKIQNKHFSLLIHYTSTKNIKNDDCNSRLGLVVSKKVDKTAVGRNRIKRLVRESFRIRPNLKLADYAILAKPACKKADNKMLLASLDHLWQQTEK
ncbi:ribonuclease P protein component [Marinicella rhabdoformis]|uniref:ribonuclease P protein component n=1 Tax=Marinicella rhabdoformis TaxID=2580566 RepID=UPI0015CF9D30